MLLNKKCPFCDSRLNLETYNMSKKKGVSGWQTEVYCDADNCDIKPSSISGSAQNALADVAEWGRVISK